MARSSFYYGLQLIKKPEKHRKEKERVKEIFEKNKSRYGYRRITMELKKEGRTINHKTVLKWGYIVKFAEKNIILIKEKEEELLQIE